MAENMLSQITATMRNITIDHVADKVSRIIPDSMERVTAGLSRFLLINLEKYTHFVSNLEEGDSFALQLIGFLGYKLYLHSDTIFMYIHLILAALFPIFIGAHASLSRPSSAAPASKKTPKSSGNEQDEDEIPERAMDTLDKTDAIMFPVIAGVLLTGLYFLLKWLEDPALLNKLMGWYFSLMGIGATAALETDALNVLTTFVFPSVFFWKGKTYHVEPLLSQELSDAQNKTDMALHRKVRSDNSSPLPGLLSDWKPLQLYRSQLWDLRAMLTERWLFKGYVYGIGNFRSYVRLNDALGIVLGAITIAIYNFGGKPWLLTNLIGFSYCYTAFQFMSPTTFSTGSLLLTGLFFYDIIMVFYTPMMVSVATSLEVPIKLVFPGPKRGSMLGLGDVVLPGIMLALALRFDLYLHYLRKQTKATDSKTLPNQNGQPGKAPYVVDVVGRWGERFWTVGAPKEDRPDTFSKVYFTAGVIGYVLGLIVTLMVLNIFNHAQPALLYLVPGVLLSLWGTALIRGEFKLMQQYSEAAQEDLVGGSNSGDEKISALKIKRQEEHAHHVFLFSLTKPKNLSSTQKNKISEGKSA